MSSALGTFRANLPYGFVVMGVLWLVVSVLDSSVLLLWPVAACLVGGVLLRMRPRGRLSWAWATAAGVMGLVLALYMAYVAAPLLTGSLSTVAAESVVVFSLFSVFQFLLVFLENSPGKAD